MDLITTLLQSGLAQAAPIILVALGEIISERSGVLNLGLEGMMLAGALFGFMGTYFTGSLLVGCLVGIAAGTIFSLIHAILTISFRANQIVSGLALTIFGGGFTAFLGSEPIAWLSNLFNAIPVEMSMAVPRASFRPIALPGLSQIPVLGPILFNQNLLVYITILLIFGVWFMLNRTRFGLNIRSVGENPACAEVMGVPVNRTRYICVLIGGAFAGLGGAYLSLALSPGWKEMMSGGRGWVAIAIVIFGNWKAVLGSLGAFLFGSLYALDSILQAHGTMVPTHFLQMLPYLATIGFLVIARTKAFKKSMGAPEALTNPYHRESRE
ncbi:MAG: ABC transporter permease [Candidatus Auribacterota bacterium]|nr:ABC transporter permease [Candidatus Auribacterota bacterium]